MLDEKGRLFGKVSIVDLAIIFIVVLLVAGYLYRDRAAGTPTEAKTVVVKVVCNGVYPGTENSIKVGDHLVASGGLTNVKITDIRVEQANWTVETADGQINLTTNPFRKDIYLTLEGKTSQITPAEITFAGQKCRVGKEDFFIKTQKVEALAIVRDIAIKGE